MLVVLEFRSALPEFHQTIRLHVLLSIKGFLGMLLYLPSTTLWIRTMHLNQAQSKPTSSSTSPLQAESVWPDYFPNGCPGDRGIETKGAVFQFIRTQPATEQDVKSAMETGKYPTRCACLRSSLSCYLNFNHIKEVQNSGGFWGNCYIASCELAPEMGRIQPTGNRNHQSLWLKKKSFPIYLANLEVQE